MKYFKFALLIMSLFYHSILADEIQNYDIQKNDEQEDSRFSIIHEVWWDIALVYFRNKPCQQLRIDDFYNEFPKYTEVWTPEVTNRLYGATQWNLHNNLQHKTIILMFMYKDMYFVVIDLAVNDLDLSLNVRKIGCSLYMGYLQLLAFDCEYNFIGGVTDQ